MSDYNYLWLRIWDVKMRELIEMAAGLMGQLRIFTGAGVSYTPAFRVLSLKTNLCQETHKITLC